MFLEDGDLVIEVDDLDDGFTFRCVNYKQVQKLSCTFFVNLHFNILSVFVFTCIRHTEGELILRHLFPLEVYSSHFDFAIALIDAEHFCRWLGRHLAQECVD